MQYLDYDGTQRLIQQLTYSVPLATHSQSGTTNDNRAYLPVAVTAGNTYRIEFDLEAITARTGVLIRTCTGQPGTIKDTIGGGYFTSTGKYEFVFTATQDASYFYVFVGVQANTNLEYDCKVYNNIIDRLPSPPNSDGSYSLSSTVTSHCITYTWDRKPVVIWQDDTGLSAIQADISANPAWQLTNLDFSPYKRIKVYAKSGRGSTNAGTTPQMMVEMLLDDRCKVTYYGGHYVGSTLSQKPNDSNRYASLTVAVSADKTSFAVLRQTSLYGTAATTNNDIGANVFMIEGYYD